MNIPTYAKSSEYFPVVGLFIGAASVTVAITDLSNGAAVSLSSAAMSQVGATAYWQWVTSNFTTQPVAGKRLLIVCTPDVGETWDEVIIVGGAADVVYDNATAIAALNDLDTTAVEGAVGTALSTATIATAGDVSAVGSAVAGLNDIDTGDVESAVGTAITTATLATSSEVTAVGSAVSALVIPDTTEIETAAAAANTTYGAAKPGDVQLIVPVSA
jgi:hypothetical protein